MTSTRTMMVTTNVKDNILSLEDTENTILGEELEEDSNNYYNDEDGRSAKPCIDVVDDLELHEINILKCIAKNGTDQK